MENFFTCWRTVALKRYRIARIRKLERVQNANVLDCRYVFCMNGWFCKSSAGTPQKFALLASSLPDFKIQRHCVKVISSCHILLEELGQSIAFPFNADSYALGCCHPIGLVLSAIKSTRSIFWQNSLLVSVYLVNILPTFLMYHMWSPQSTDDGVFARRSGRVFECHKDAVVFSAT